MNPIKIKSYLLCAISRQFFLFLGAKKNKECFLRYPVQISVLKVPTHNPLHAKNRRSYRMQKENNFNNNYI